MTWPFPSVDSDANGIDRAMDDLATGDPYDPHFEPPFGLNHVAVIAATQASDTLIAGSYPADARATDSSSSPSRGVAATSELPQKGTRQ